MNNTNLTICSQCDGKGRWVNSMRYFSDIHHYAEEERSSEVCNKCYGLGYLCEGKGLSGADKLEYLVKYFQLAKDKSFTGEQITKIISQGKYINGEILAYYYNQDRLEKLSAQVSDVEKRKEKLDGELETLVKSFKVPDIFK